MIEKNCAFLVHVGSDPSSEHNNSVKECHDLLNNPIHIDNVMENRKNMENERNRLRLRTSITAMKWLIFQSYAFRGHDETPPSKNRGKFVELIKLIVEFNPEIASVVLDNAPQCAKYTSPDIQKEILSILTLKVKKHIREEIGDAKFYIIEDETCDVLKREQMPIVIRFVDAEGVLRERFFYLIHVKNTKALTLKATINYALSIHGFDLQNLRGQGYDGASNMRGQLNGLQALFLKDCPYGMHIVYILLLWLQQGMLFQILNFFRNCSLLLTHLTHHQSIITSFIMHKWLNLQGCWVLMILRPVKEQIKSAQ
jgi:hypothetical protein